MTRITGANVKKVKNYRSQRRDKETRRTVGHSWLSGKRKSEPKGKIRSTVVEARADREPVGCVVSCRNRGIGINKSRKSLRKRENKVER